MRRGSLRSLVGYALFAIVLIACSVGVVMSYYSNVRATPYDYLKAKLSQAIEHGMKDPIISQVVFDALRNVSGALVASSIDIVHVLPGATVERTYCNGFLLAKIVRVNGESNVTVNECSVLIQNEKNVTDVVEIVVEYYISSFSLLRDSVKTFAVFKALNKVNYVEEGGIGDIVQKPRETLVRGGDCEDIAVLTSSMLMVLGVKSGVAVLRVPNKPVFHAVTVVCPSYDLSWFMTELAILYSWRAPLRYIEIPEGCVLLDPQVTWAPWNISFEKGDVAFVVFVESTT